MGHKRYQLSTKEINNLKQGLSDCELIRQDLERAQLAGVPNIEAIQEAVTTCEERINKLLEQYKGSNKR